MLSYLLWPFTVLLNCLGWSAPTSKKGSCTSKPADGDVTPSMQSAVMPPIACPSPTRQAQHKATCGTTLEGNSTVPKETNSVSKGSSSSQPQQSLKDGFCLSPSSAKPSTPKPTASPSTDDARTTGWESVGYLTSSTASNLNTADGSPSLQRQQGLEDTSRCFPSSPSTPKPAASTSTAWESVGPLTSIIGPVLNAAGSSHMESQDTRTPGSVVPFPPHRFMKDGKKVVGVANTTAKHAEDRPIIAHCTPWDKRLARAMKLEDEVMKQAAVSSTVTGAVAARQG